MNPFYTNVILSIMAGKSASSKSRQLTLEEYAKVKEKLAKSKLKLNLPVVAKICFAVPLAYLVLLIIFFLAHVRLLPEH